MVLFPLFRRRGFSDADETAISGVAQRGTRAKQRRDRALQQASDHARGRPRRSETAQGREGTHGRHGRTRESARLYLAAAGVGTIGIVDFDVVDESNLQRQIIHGTSDVGRPKVQSAYEKIKDINPNVEVRGHEEALTSENALEIFEDYDVIVDGTDNFPTRYLVNDACVLLKKPNVYGSIFRFEGQASVFYAEEGPCYRCLYPEPPPPGLVPSCAEGGVLGILPGAIGTIQATETVKLILGIGEPLVG